MSHPRARRYFQPFCLLTTALLSLAAVVLAAAPAKEYKSGIIWPMPPVIQPGEDDAPPSDAIVLFDGSDMSQFKGGEGWKVENGYVQVGGRGGVTSQQAFGDCQLHVEFATPEVVKGSGQGRGNSGIYLMGKYEVQILDSYDNQTYYDGQCGAIYKQQPPMVNVCRKPGEWQTYDILFTAPRFDDEGQLSEPAYVTVLHNGVVIHNHFQLQGGTSYNSAPAYRAHPPKLPLHIQNHGNPTRFRNIWIRENVAPLVGKKP